MHVTALLLLAVIERHGGRGCDPDDLPAIQVIVTEDENEVGIKFSDQGGGIPRQDMPVSDKAHHECRFQCSPLLLFYHS